MSYTKRQFVLAAYEELGVASYEFDLAPEELESGLRRLDAMMAEWNGKGIRLSYPLPGKPEDSDLDEDTGVPDSANNAIIKNLAIQIAPRVGKQVSPETRISAKQAFNVILARACFPAEMQMPGEMPVGMGNKPYRTARPFVNPPKDNLDAGPDSVLTFP